MENKENLKVLNSESLEDRCKRLEKENIQLRKYADQMKAMHVTMEIALGKAIELHLYRLAPFTNTDQYINKNEKAILLAYLGKFLAPIAQILSFNKKDVFMKQLQSLVGQVHNSFLQMMDMFEHDLQVNFAGNKYVIKDKDGKDPFVLQLDGEKGHLHKAPLAKFIKAIHESDEPGEEVPTSVLEDSN